jgi:glucosyl-dolichyl phosphate glucuronosyltransferase
MERGYDFSPAPEVASTPLPDCGAMVMNEQVDVSVIVSSYNRCDMLPETIESLLAQEADGLCYEIIIVDNNSTDATKQVVESYMRDGRENLHYVFEGRQGVSHGRNAGIKIARAPIVAFADDDVRVARNWVATIKRAFDEHPEVNYVGGKVLPHWQTEMPLWITRYHWSPLAIQDYGDTALYLNSERRLCLVGASLSFRREALDSLGLFAPDLQRVKDNIGSMEDLDLQLRAWQAGMQGLYIPELVATTEIPPARLTREYHRRWHTGQGHFYALLRLKEMEESDKQRLFDLPAHLYKQSVMDVIGWLKHKLSRDSDGAFACETRLRFFVGFFRTRREDHLATWRRGNLREVLLYLRSLIPKKPRHPKTEGDS